MNILHIVNTFFATNHIIGEGQIKYFQENGDKVIIACPFGEGIPEFEKRVNAKVHVVDIVNEISLSKDFKAISQLRKIIKENKIDVVIGHTPKGGLLSMIAAFSTCVRKRIYFRHGLVYQTAKGLLRHILLNTDRITSLFATDIICVSNSVAEESIKDKLNPKSKQKVLLNGTCNGVEYDFFSKETIADNQREKLKKKYNINPSDIVIGFSGRFVKDKGIVELIEAFNILKASHKNLKLLLVGFFYTRDILPEWVIEQIKTDKDIIATDLVSRANMPLHYSIMDIFILPSYREGFSTVLLEASSMQLPIITTNVTGCIDAVIDNKTGYIVDICKKQIVEKSELLINNPEIRKELGKNGRLFVQENFTPESIWAAIKQITIN